MSPDGSKKDCFFNKLESKTVVFSYRSFPSMLGALYSFHPKRMRKLGDVYYFINELALKDRRKMVRLYKCIQTDFTGSTGNFGLF